MPVEQKHAKSEIAASVSYLNESESTSDSFLKDSATTSKVDAIDLSCCRIQKNVQNEFIEAFILTMMC